MTVVWIVVAVVAVAVIAVSVAFMYRAEQATRRQADEEWRAYWREQYGGDPPEVP